MAFRQNSDIFYLSGIDQEESILLLFPDSPDEKMREILFLRETNEEIGLPSTSLEVWGELDQYKTHTSNYLLSVFVCLIHYPFQLKINEEEVDEIIEVPLDDLLDDSQWVHKDVTVETGSHRVWFFDFQSKIIWGATAEIMKRFITLLHEEP